MESPDELELVRGMELVSESLHYLKSLEWSDSVKSYSLPNVSLCPECGGLEWDGHKIGCKLGSLIYRLTLFIKEYQ